MPSHPTHSPTHAILLDSIIAFPALAELLITLPVCVCVPTDAGLTEEEVLLEKAASQDKDAEMAVQRATLVLRLREGINSLARVLKVIEVSVGELKKIDKRKKNQRK